jgi:hypothetical protein
MSSGSAAEAPPATGEKQEPADGVPPLSKNAAKQKARREKKKAEAELLRSDAVAEQMAELALAKRLPSGELCGRQQIAAWKDAHWVRVACTVHYILSALQLQTVDRDSAGCRRSIRARLCG